MKIDFVCGIDTSMIYAALGGDCDIDRAAPVADVIAQARQILDGAPSIFRLAIFKGEFTNCNEFLRVVEKVFTAEKNGGDYVPAPNTDDNRQILRNILVKYDKQILDQYAKLANKAMDFYKEKTADATLLKGVALISPPAPEL